MFALRLILRSTIEGIVEKRVQEQQEQEQEQASAQTQHEDLLKYMLRANQEDDSKVTKVLETSLSLFLFPLSLCLPASTNTKVTKAGLADNLLTLLFAGFDTTSIALTWTFYLLAKHPEVEAKVLAEISSSSLTLFALKLTRRQRCLLRSPLCWGAAPAPRTSSPTRQRGS